MRSWASIVSCVASAIAVAACGASTNTASESFVDAGAPNDDAVATDADAARDAIANPGPRDGATDLAPADTWTWLDVPGARCANGSPTGIGVNVHPGAKRVFVFLQGGGACATADTCWIHPTATNMATGYGVASFVKDVPNLAAPLQRSILNPLRDATFVYVPYCTGDVHVGTGVATYSVDGIDTPTYHYGARNLDLYMAKLAAALPRPDRLWIYGASAGGYGSFLNQEAVTTAFGGVRVDLVDDSGPPIDSSAIGDAAANAWGARISPACTDCVGPKMLTKAFAYARAKYPDTRYAFVTYQTDTVLPSLYGVTPADFAGELSQLVTSLAADPNARTFLAIGSGHVVGSTSSPLTGVHLLSFLGKMVTDDPTWANVVE